MKSRGMVHSAEVRRFKISSEGIHIFPSTGDNKGSLTEIKRKVIEHEKLSTSKKSISAKKAPSK
jgi:hypothetical protein